MAKLKAAATAELRPTANVTPIGQGRKPRAVGTSVPTAPADQVTSETKPAVIVFGKDEAGKAHASWFSTADAELATEAAGLMGYSVLPVASPDIAAKERLV